MKKQHNSNRYGLARTSGKESGFTLLEVLMASVISMVVIGVVFYLYTNQLATRTVQNSVLSMQQNIRAAMYLIGRDVRMTGYQGTVAGDKIAGIVDAGPTLFTFTFLAESDGVDNDADGETDEYDELSTISYGLYDADADTVAEEIGRTQDNDTGLVAEGIEGLDFLYILQDGTRVRTPSDPGQIRTVEVTILARTLSTDKKFISTQQYLCPEASDSTRTEWGPFNDSFHRKMLTGIFLLRNMGG